MIEPAEDVQESAVCVFSHSRTSGGESPMQQHQKNLRDLQEQLEHLEARCLLLNEEMKKKQQALLKGKEERDTLRFKFCPPEPAPVRKFC